jgi:hypothetical protein
MAENTDYTLKKSYRLFNVGFNHFLNDRGWNKDLNPFLGLKRA